jgi:hypothetical protein
VAQYFGKKTNTVPACRCCFGKKERDGSVTCPPCKDCYFHYGFWKKGETCPVVQRGRKTGKLRRAAK